MTDAQRAKLDIIVSMGGQGTADAQKLLGALNQVEKVEKEIAKAAEQHQRFLERRTKESQQATQRGLGVVAGGLSGGPLGALSAMGGTAGAVGGVVAAAEQGLNKMARAAEIAAAANTTVAQRSRMLVEELLPFGKAIHTFIDALTGVSQALFDQQQKFEISQRRTDSVARHNVQERAFESERATQVFRRRFMDAIPAAPYQDFDRSTVEGRRAFAEQSARLPAVDALRSAQVESGAAVSMREAERAREAQIRERVTDLESRRRVLGQRLEDERQKENMFGGVRNQVGIDRAAADVLENEKRIAAETAALSEQAVRAKEAGVRAAEAESRTRRAMIDTQKAELDILRQREQRMAALQQTVGTLSRGEFAGSLRALQMVQNRGIENVSAQTAQRAAQIAPEFLAAQREQLGGQRMELARGALGAEGFRRVYGGDFAPGQALADTRRQIDRVQADIRVNIQIDERQTAQELARAIDPIFRRLIDVFQIEVRRIESEVKAGAIRQGNATNGAAR